MLTEDSERTYHRLPSLRKEENNILLFLTWSSTYHGQTLRVLSDWIRSEESLILYKRLIGDLLLHQNPEEFALTLAALLCRERLLPYRADDVAQLGEGSCLAGLTSVSNRQDISNRRTVFAQLISLLARVLYNLKTSEETLQFLVEVFNKDISLVDPLYGLVDQYCTMKIQGHDHNRAFEEAREWLSKCAEAMRNRDRDSDADWVVVSRSLL